MSGKMAAVIALFPFFVLEFVYLSVWCPAPLLGVKSPTMASSAPSSDSPVPGWGCGGGSR